LQSSLPKSFHLVPQLPRFTQQGPNLLSLGDGVPCEQAALVRVLISAWRTGVRRTDVHAAARLAAQRRRLLAACEPVQL